MPWLKDQREAGAIEFGEREARRYMRVASNRTRVSDLDAAPSIRAVLELLSDKRLYRATHATFEDYCRERLGIARNYANKRLVFDSVLEELGTRVPNSLPATERQARPPDCSWFLPP